MLRFACALGARARTPISCVRARVADHAHADDAKPTHGNSAMHEFERARAAAAVDAARAAGIDPAFVPPIEPTTCCGNGCAMCVWIPYFEAQAAYHAALEARERAAAATLAPVAESLPGAQGG